VLGLLLTYAKFFLLNAATSKPVRILVNLNACFSETLVFDLPLPVAVGSIRCT
jgi:hypothetical protein